jgi:hypothetical protein
MAERKKMKSDGRNREAFTESLREAGRRLYF